MLADAGPSGAPGTEGAAGATDAGAKPDNGDVIVDLAGVTFIDGSTLGALIHARRRMSERNRWLTVRAPSRSAQHLLELCGLTALLETRCTTDHARVVADAKVDGTDYGF